MPRFKNHKGEYEFVDVIFNSSTMINRENVGQTFELSLTHIGSAILEKIKKENLSLDKAYKLIWTYVNFCSPEQASYLEERRKTLTREEFAFFIESIVDSGAIHLSMKPISDSMSIDKLNDMYKAFPFVKQNVIEVAIRDSEGKPRYVKARRPIIIGKQYIYRLKQFAEEKFSATSLSATNIRNENTKSRAKKDYKELFPNTPIRFGNMESNNQLHLGAEVVISNMMIHSLSPLGRRLVEKMYTGDPYKIDIKLDSDSSNRQAEIANTYLKAIARKLIFEKKRKKRHIVAECPIRFNSDPYYVPIMEMPKDLPADYDPVEALRERTLAEKKKKRNKKLQSPVAFIPRDPNRTDDLI